MSHYDAGCGPSQLRSTGHIFNLMILDERGRDQIIGRTLLSISLSRVSLAARSLPLSAARLASKSRLIDRGNAKSGFTIPEQPVRCPPGLLCRAPEIDLLRDSAARVLRERGARSTRN